MSISQLPNEIIVEIVKKLDPLSVIKLIITCKKYNNLDTNYIWKIYYLSKYPSTEDIIHPPQANYKWLVFFQLNPTKPLNKLFVQSKYGTTIAGEFIYDDQAKIYLPNGYCKCISTGYSYEGQYKEGIMHGKGKYKLMNGNIYEGDMVNGRMHGKGVYKTRNSIYDGEFKEGKFDGIGIFTLNNHGNNIIYRGIFKDNSCIHKLALIPHDYSFNDNNDNFL
jgi:hypothetical protein